LVHHGSGPRYTACTKTTLLPAWPNTRPKWPSATPGSLTSPP
jgi:hypothetical protein